jgi:DNA-binding NtrC family response regulator
LTVGETCTIGGGTQADLRLSDPELLSKHVQLRAEADCVRVCAVEPGLGFWIGGSRVESADLTGSNAAFVVGRTAVSIARWVESEEVSLTVPALPGLIGEGPAMRRVCEQIRCWAPLHAPVLLYGETGTGKEVVAKALHELSSRQGPYLGVNVGGMGENLADAELFGHRRGAFTGAIESRVGVFEAAAGGTLLLDEIGDLPLTIQIKLLRVLEERRIRPLGGNKHVELTARIISASWAQMEQRVAQGRFRLDLFHRISTLSIELPPLRRRRSDIADLAEHLLKRHATELGPKRVSPAALALLVAYRFPGNIRELGSILYRAAALTHGEEIQAAVVAALLPRTLRKANELTPALARALVLQHGGNVSAAAREAQLARTTFRALLASSG